MDNQKTDLLSLLPAELAVRAIKESGGVAVYAHCLGGEGT